MHADDTLDVVPADPDDNRVLACALKADSDTVVTGDTDLLVMGSFRGISQNPGDFLVAAGAAAVRGRCHEQPSPRGATPSERSYR